MMLADHLDLVMFAVLILALMSGYPVALVLAGVAVLFAGVGIAFGVFDPALLTAAPNRLYGIMTNPVLVSVPLFVFMGVMLERSKLAEELLGTIGRLFGGVRGGLGIAVVAVGGLLAASTGIVGATVVTMGLLSLPTMLQRGYNPSLAAGAIASSGTLGQIIPPSIALVLLADVISNAHQQAQRSLGNFAPEPISVSDVFAGALVPGLVLVALYMAYVAVVAIVRPDMAPRGRTADEARVTVSEIVSALLPPIGLVIAVLGSIIAGLATPTEAAALGAIGALMLAGARIGDRHGRAGLERAAVFAGLGAAIGLVALTSFVDLRLGRDDVSVGDRAGMALAGLLCLVIIVGLLAAWRRLWPGGQLHAVARETGRISAMVFLILIGATVFTLVFRGLGGDELVARLLAGATDGLLGAIGAVLGGGEAAAAFIADPDHRAVAGLLVVMLVMFVLGFFLDFIEITFVVVPLVAPPLLALGVDPIWLAVLMAVNLQTSFLTPPFGFALFYLRGVAPPEVTTPMIYRGVAPFVGLQLLALALIALVPSLATWLPLALRPT